MEIVDLLNVGRQTLSIRIGGLYCHLKLWRQPEDGYWYINVEAPGGTPVVVGRRLTSNTPVLNGRISLLAGDLLCVPLARGLGDPDTAGPWGVTHNLVYAP